MALSTIFRQGSAKYTQILIRNTNSANFSKALINGPVTKNFLKSNQLPKDTITRFMSGDHAQQWKLEKLLTIIMFPIIPATFINPGTEVLDQLFAVLVTTHAHFGLEAMAKDYIRPIIFGSLIPKIALALVYVLTATTLGSLLYFNHHNIGIGAAGQKIWSIGKTKKETA